MCGFTLWVDVLSKIEGCEMEIVGGGKRRRKRRRATSVGVVLKFNVRESGLCFFCSVHGISGACHFWVLVCVYVVVVLLCFCSPCSSLPRYSKPLPLDVHRVMTSCVEV